jgi:hypothetical protein
MYGCVFQNRENFFPRTDQVCDTHRIPPLARLVANGRTIVRSMQWISLRFFELQVEIQRLRFGSS